MRRIWVPIATATVVFGGLIAGYIANNGSGPPGQANVNGNIYMSTNGTAFSGSGHCIWSNTVVANPDPGGTTLCTNANEAQKAMVAAGQTSGTVVLLDGQYTTSETSVNYLATRPAVAAGTCQAAPAGVALPDGTVVAPDTTGCLTFTGGTVAQPDCAANPSTTVRVRGDLWTNASGIRFRNLCVVHGAISAEWKDIKNGIPCNTVPQPHDDIFDGLRNYEDVVPPGGDASNEVSNGFGFQGVRSMSFINSYVGPVYDFQGTSQLGNLTQSSTCAGFTVPQLMDWHIAIVGNTFKDQIETVTPNMPGCGTSQVLGLCNHAEDIHWRASDSWAVNNTFLNGEQYDIAVQTFCCATSGGGVPTINNVLISQNVFDLPCSHQTGLTQPGNAPCAIIDGIRITCNATGDNITNFVVSYNSGENPPQFAGPSVNPCVWGGNAAIGNLSRQGYSSFGCTSQQTASSVQYAVTGPVATVGGGGSSVVCGTGSLVISSPSNPFTDQANYNFTTSAAAFAAGVANLVPTSVTANGHSVVCPSFDPQGDQRPKGSNTKCAAGVDEEATAFLTGVSTAQCNPPPGNGAPCTDPTSLSGPFSVGNVSNDPAPGGSCTTCNTPSARTIQVARPVGLTASSTNLAPAVIELGNTLNPCGYSVSDTSPRLVQFAAAHRFVVVMPSCGPFDSCANSCSGFPTGQCATGRCFGQNWYKKWIANAPAGSGQATGSNDIPMIAATVAYITQCPASPTAGQCIDPKRIWIEGDSSTAAMGPDALCDSSTNSLIRGYWMISNSIQVGTSQPGAPNCPNPATRATFVMQSAGKFDNNGANPTSQYWGINPTDVFGGFTSVSGQWSYASCGSVIFWGGGTCGSTTMAGLEGCTGGVVRNDTFLPTGGVGGGATHRRADSMGPCSTGVQAGSAAAEGWNLDFGGHGANCHDSDSATSFTGQCGSSTIGGTTCGPNATVCPKTNAWYGGREFVAFMEQAKWTGP